MIILSFLKSCFSDFSKVHFFIFFLTETSEISQMKKTSAQNKRQQSSSYPAIRYFSSCSSFKTLQCSQDILMLGGFDYILQSKI